jgi:hypothetical protein
MCDLVSHQSVDVASDHVDKPALPAREVRSTRRVVRGRRRRVRMPGVAKGPKAPQPAEGICKAHPTRRRVIVGVVALRSVERRYDRRTSAASNKVVAISRVPAAAGRTRRVSRGKTRHSGDNSRRNPCPPHRPRTRVLPGLPTLIHPLAHTPPR